MVDPRPGFCRFAGVTDRVDLRDVHHLGLGCAVRKRRLGVNANDLAAIFAKVDDVPLDLAAVVLERVVFVDNVSV